MIADVVSLSLNAAVFTQLGIAHGTDIARANPHYRATVTAGLSKLTSFLADLGLIDDEDRWAELGLVNRFNGTDHRGDRSARPLAVPPSRRRRTRHPHHGLGHAKDTWAPVIAELPTQMPRRGGRSSR